MANKVFANGREVSCKAGAGKTIASFPDVCMTPPENPATPPGVPVPYPNTGLSSDTTGGTKSVKISGKEVGIKDKSCFKKSTGDEAGCATKKGVMSSKNTGKVYFTSWSSDVKFEGKNAVRHLDTTTNNHGSNANEALPWPHIDTQTIADTSPCKDDKDKKDTACKDKDADPCPGALNVSVDTLKEAVQYKGKRTTKVLKAALGDYKHPGGTRSPKAAAVAGAAANKCVEASRCHLRPYDGKKNGKKGCCPGQTPHHVPPKTSFLGKGRYNDAKALCVCMEGSNQFVGSHGKNHAALDYLTVKEFPGAMITSGADAGTIDSSKIGKLKTKRYIEISAAAVAAQTGCDPKCIEAQLNQSFKKDHKIKDDTQVEPYISLKNQNQAGQTAAEYQKSAIGDIKAALDTAIAKFPKAGPLP